MPQKKRTVDGKVQTPRMYGAEGWYGWKDGLRVSAEQPRDLVHVDEGSDRARAPDHPWVAFLEGKQPGFPRRPCGKTSSASEMAQAERDDTTTPDTRLADARLDINPASVTALIHLMEGGMHIAARRGRPDSPPTGGSLHYARLRYFDAERAAPACPRTSRPLSRSWARTRRSSLWSTSTRSRRGR
jgi:hypothetical protein